MPKPLPDRPSSTATFFFITVPWYGSAPSARCTRLGLRIASARGYQAPPPRSPKVFQNRGLSPSEVHLLRELLILKRLPHKHSHKVLLFMGLRGAPTD